jgi:hypothetical protein
MSDYTNFEIKDNIGEEVKVTPFKRDRRGQIIAMGGPREGGYHALDLTNTNKVLQGKPTIRLANKKTGEIIELEKTELRLSRERKRIFSWSEALKPLFDKYEILMIGLTYRPGEKWEKNDIRSYMLSLRKFLGTFLYAYAWVAELQERKAVHFHIMIAVKKGIKIPLPDKSGMWKKGSSNVTKVKSPFYLVSYMKKAYQKEGIFPKGLRLFAVWISKAVISELELWKFRLSTLPEWMRGIVNSWPEKEGERWERAPGGGYNFSGEFYESPFKFLGYSR